MSAIIFVAHISTNTPSCLSTNFHYFEISLRLINLLYWRTVIHLGANQGILKLQLIFHKTNTVRIFDEIAAELGLRAGKESASWVSSDSALREKVGLGTKKVSERARDPPYDAVRERLGLQEHPS